MANSRSKSVIAGLSALWQQCSAALVRAALLVSTVSVVGCINTPFPDYYVLTPERSSTTGFEQINLSDLAVGLGPITVPETVNRPNIVTPQDNNQLLVAEYHRWSEPVRDNLSRVLIANLANRLSINKLYPYPWLGNAVDYQVRLDVIQMVGGLGRQVFMQVRWQILTGDRPARLIDTKISEYNVAVQGQGYSNMVAAYSMAIAQLSDDIARQLASLTGNAIPNAAGEPVELSLE